MKLGARVYHYEDPDMWGRVIELYTGTKVAMKGMVKVEWYDGSWSWEWPSELGGKE